MKLSTFKSKVLGCFQPKLGSVIHNSTRFKRRCHDKEWQSQITSKAELRLRKWRQLRGRRGRSEAAVLQMETRAL